MRKNKEYISDVQQKITELHKLERWGGEFEWTTAGELQKKVEFRGQKTF